MNYKIIEDGILETQTNEIIYKNDDKDILREVLRGCNFGKGFDGWTPAFFLQKLELSESTT